MIKDKFTRAEFLEFFIGAFITLLLSYTTIDALSQRFPDNDLARPLILFLITITICVVLLWLRDMDKYILRVIAAASVSAIIVPFFLYFIFRMDVSTRVDLYIIAVSACTIGALTIDILRDDT